MGRHSRRTADFEQVQTQYNAGNAYGLAIDASVTTGTINATATDSISSNNGGGFIAEAATGGTTLMLVRCTASNNHTGVQNGNAVGPGVSGTVYMSQVAILGNVVGWQNDGPAFGGAVFSYGDNTIDFDQTADVAPPSTAKK